MTDFPFEEACGQPSFIEAVLEAISTLKGKKAPTPMLSLQAIELAQLTGALRLEDLPTAARDKQLAMISPLNSDITRNEAKIALWASGPLGSVQR